MGTLRGGVTLKCEFHTNSKTCLIVQGSIVQPAVAPVLEWSFRRERGISLFIQ